MCHQTLQNVTCCRTTEHFVQQEKSVVQTKNKTTTTTTTAKLEMLQICLDRISVWSNAKHMIINPVKTK